MRREIYRGSTADAWALLARAPFLQLSCDGPMLRTLNAVVFDDAIYFHGAPAGEKMEHIGQRAIVSAEEHVASIPSYVRDPERACPATTYYRSVQAHGVLERVTDVPLKARMLTAFMEKYQPEGGYRPFSDPMYKAAVEGILVLRMQPERVDGKWKLGQNLKPDERRAVMTWLWQRGETSAIDAMCDANSEQLFEGPCARLYLSPQPQLLAKCAALLKPQYWNEDYTEAELAAVFARSDALLIAVDANGEVIGTARANGDGIKWVGIYDICVAERARGKGLGVFLVKTLLDHARVRSARVKWLRTRDAHSLYERFGFTRVNETEMRSA